MARLLFLGDFLGDCNKDIHREKADTILVITGQVLEQGYHFLDDDCRVHLLDEFGEIIRRLSSHHRGFIMHKNAKILPEALLQRLRSTLVWDAVQACSGDLRGKPVRFREA